MSALHRKNALSGLPDSPIRRTAAALPQAMLQTSAFFLLQSRRLEVAVAAVQGLQGAAATPPGAATLGQPPTAAHGSTTADEFAFVASEATPSLPLRSMRGAQSTCRESAMGLLGVLSRFLGDFEAGQVVSVFFNPIPKSWWSYSAVRGISTTQQETFNTHPTIS